MKQADLEQLVDTLYVSVSAISKDLDELKQRLDELEEGIIRPRQYVEGVAH